MYVVTDDVFVVCIAITITDRYFYGRKNKAIVKGHKAP
jgi:hypothetical protein